MIGASNSPNSLLKAKIKWIIVLIFQSFMIIFHVK
jgi:hypothetical protein